MSSAQGGQPERRPGPEIGRAVAAVLLVVVTVVLVATAREASISHDEAVAADAAGARSDWPGAIAHARASAEAFVPGSSWPERSLRRLATIGHDAEARGDDATALLAYGAIRSAELATRVPGAKSARWRTEADERLARVAAAHTGTEPARQAADSMLEALRHDDAPTDLALALLMASTLATLVALGWLAWLGSEGSGARVARAVAAAGLVAYAAVLLTN
jgi:hypothetical protein